MKASVTIESLKGPVGEFLLASVTNSDGIIGICDTSIKSGIRRKSLYAGAECLINIQYRENSDDTNRVIWQTSSIDKAKTVLGTKLPKICESYFSGSTPLSKAVMPILEMLANGLYVIHVGKVYPSDGAGNFFWDAFTIKHEIFGSAPYNSVIGDGKSYSPPFLIPTQSFSAYTENAVGAAAEKLVNGKKLGGIAFHITGMFSALLEGHINAAACVANGYDFNCIIIEPLNRVIYGEPGSIDENKVVALSCPFVKISFENISRKMLENFLTNRSVCVPREYSEIKWKADKMLSNGVLSRKVSAAIDRNIEGMPDAEMMASAYAIDELTDNDLNILLNGSATDDDGRVIISPNFFESITYAINFLQLKDRRRFIEFSDSIIRNPDLSGAYGYVANRLKYVMDAKVNELFKYISESDNANYAAIKPIAERYAKAYSEYSEGNVKRFLNSAPSSAPARSSAVDALMELGGRKGYSGDASLSREDTYSSLELSKSIANK